MDRRRRATTRGTRRTSPPGQRPAAPARAGFLDKLLGGGTPSDEKIAAGLKEALEIGTGNTVAVTGRIAPTERRVASSTSRIAIPPSTRSIAFGSAAR